MSFSNPIQLARKRLRGSYEKISEEDGKSTQLCEGVYCFNNPFPLFNLLLFRVKFIEHRAFDFEIVFHLFINATINEGGHTIAVHGNLVKW
jgi:hypothetical protein